MKTILKIVAIEVCYFLTLIIITVFVTSMLGGGKLLGELIAFLQYKGPSSPLIISIFLVTVGISVIAFKFKPKPITDFSPTDSIGMIIGMIIAAIVGWVISFLAVLLILQFYIVVIRFFDNITKGYQAFPK